MNHLESAFKGKNQFWRYILMIGLVYIVLNILGSIPLMISLLVKFFSDPDTISEFASSKNIGVLGMSQNWSFFVMVFPFVIGFLTFIFLMKPIHHRSFINVVNGTDNFRWRRFFISAAVWVILQCLFLFVYLKTDPGNFTINNQSTSWLVLIVISLLVIPFQASFEEVLFRGYFMQGFAALARNRWFPLLATSLLFGLLHAFNPEVKEYGFLTMMPQYILFGLIFGVITVFDDGIETAMGAHTANNVFVSTLVTQKSSALQTPALFEQHNIYPWMDFTGMLLSGIVFFLILRIIFKWNDLSVIMKKVEKKNLPVSDPVN